MRGMNQVDLAKASGVAQNTISEIELGKREARPGTLKKLADALDVSIAQLLESPSPKKAEAPPSQQLTLNGLLAEERRFRPDTREVKNLDLFCTKVERRLDRGHMSPDEIDIALDAVEGFVAVVAATMSDAMFERFISLGHRLLEAAKEMKVRGAAEAEAGVARLEEWKDRRAG